MKKNNTDGFLSLTLQSWHVECSNKNNLSAYRTHTVAVEMILPICEFRVVRLWFKTVCAGETVWKWSHLRKTLLLKKYGLNKKQDENNDVNLFFEDFKHIYDEMGTQF